MRIVIIGGGPGGYVAAITAAQAGADVTLIESRHIGGTCLNIGCIPTKVLLNTTDLLDTLKNDAKEFGVIVAEYKADWDKIQKRKQKMVKRLVGGVNNLLKSYGITKLMGQAFFEDAHQIRVEIPASEKEMAQKRMLDFDAAIIATGSTPVMPPIPGANIPGVITSEEALSLKHIPKSMCIIGGGVIGCEFASIYSALGCEVTIVEMLAELITNMDSDLVKPLKSKFIKDGIKIFTDTRVESITEANGELRVNTSLGDKKQSFDVEKVLVSTGRRPVIDTIDLEKAGIETERGAIKVDKNMKTNVPNIYAIGDCNGGVMLAHTASAEGVVAVEKIMGRKSTIDFKTVPYCVYTKPEIAGVGLTEAQAKSQGYVVKVGAFPMAISGKAAIMEETTGLVKYISDGATGEILGLHIIGPRATDLVVEGSLAIRLEATVSELMSVVHAHPTLGESLQEAAHAIVGKATHIPK